MRTISATLNGTEDRRKRALLITAVAITIVLEVVWDGSCWDKHQAHQTRHETVISRMERG